MNALREILERSGQHPVVLGERVLVLPFGGRILGLYPEPGLNALWVNPALASEQVARSLFEEEGWANLGGQRVWISPEVETNVGDPLDFWGSYSVPKAMDPAAYRVVETNGNAVTLETAMELDFHRHACPVSLNVARKVTVQVNPPVELPPDVSCVGYQAHSTLSASELPDGVRPGLWSIMQVPGGGDILVPAGDDAEPRTFFGAPTLTRDSGMLRCPVQTDVSSKFSLHARDSRGFMACLNTGLPTPVLITCRFPVLDQELYADCPADDLADTGHMQQVYVDDGALGGFGELEYHAPCLQRGARELVEDRAEVWAFAGPAEALRDLLNRVAPA